MTFTSTQTQTYTVADVKNVFEHVLADLAMIARTTGAWTAEDVAEVSDDVRAFATAGYVSRVDVVLCSPTGGTVRAHRYDVSDEAVSWVNSVPRDNIWPPANGNSLYVVLTWSAAWKALSDQQRRNFYKRLTRQWGQSSIDLGYPGLSAGEPLRYASNAFGVERRPYKKKP